MDRDSVTPDVSRIPAERAERWVSQHHEFAAPSTYVYEFVWDVTEDAIGPFCTDVDGNVLLDFTSHVAAAPLGYNNPTIRERMDAFDLPEPSKIAGQDFYASGGGTPDNTDFPGPTQLMDRLTDATSHYDMDTVFLSNTGAEAVENAIKICYTNGGHRGVTFDGGFHGRTLGALSLNRSKAVHRRGFPEIPGIVSVPYCTCTDECTCGWETDGPGGNVLADRLHPERGDLPADEVSYIILEPVQGEGGFRAPSPSFAADIEKIRHEHDISVISDEIQAGIGRTGEFWGIDHTPIEPDVITCAKGLRVGATVANEDVFPDVEGRLSSTWGAGDLLSSLQGTLTLEIIEEEKLLANATTRGRHLIEALEDATLPGSVDVRGRGLMVAVEFDTKARREAIVQAALERGLLLLGCGYKTIRFLPPLDVTAREIDLAVSLFEEATRGVESPMQTAD
ncbi:aminotransferase class III-fold pyridoxal phosphate-dependent enzyme [Halobacteria archaeon AArc-curdl1]|uniref:Aminotransferase class III-fold pyridoxal phosphate-dependent enzyme n=1 Tax=Natronosalvus hydrolyticus TaxID=2979988 RepID=A0AAP3E585_9EURY|nr:aminotransferase class III-fold pyridoxal phosphate-dependent enzyme [Halobacteria archaeon AArc-curdl1]